MPTDCKRIQKRTPATVALQVSSATQPFITELVFTENFSLHGVRVVTERAWKPGERVIVKSYHGSIQSRAKVIYCHRHKEAICRWIGTVFSGWDVGGPFATPQERKYSRATVGTGTQVLS